MPKICFLGDSSSTHIKRWCQYFKEKRWEVSLISFSSEKIQGIDCYNFSTKIKQYGGNWQYLKYLFKIKRTVRKINPDIINSHYLTSYGLVGVLINFKPHVTSTWGSDILATPFRNKFYYFLTKGVLKKVSLITSDSNFMTNMILNFGIKKIKIITQPMGVDEDIIKNSAYDRDKFFTNKEVKILSLRAMKKNSNVDLIIKTLRKLIDADKSKKYILNIANKGIEESYLKTLVKTLKLDNSVNFLGFLNREKLISEMKRNDIYISIPISDSTSVSLLEAMGIGLYPIVSNIPGNREWITNGVNGNLMPVPLQSEQLSSLILSLISKKDYIKKALGFNFKLINEKAIWKNNMKIIENKYKELIKQ